MLLTWLILGMVVVGAGVITLTVFITAAIIKEILRDDSVNTNNALSATVQKKFQDGNHTVIKINLKNSNGSTTTKEIRTDKGASVYEGQTIYKY